MDKSAPVFDRTGPIRSDRSPPGAWPEQDSTKLTRKRTAIFDQPAPKRLSPSRPISSNSFLQDLHALSPVRMIQNIFGFLAGDKATPQTSKSSNLLTQNRNADDAQVHAQQHNLSTSTTTAYLAPSLPASGLRSLSQHLTKSRMGESISSSRHTDGSNDQRKPGAYGHRSRSMEQKIARQRVLARAALLSIKQPRYNQNHDQGSAAGMADWSNVRDGTSHVGPLSLNQKPHRELGAKKQHSCTSPNNLDLTPIPRNAKPAPSNLPSPSIQLNSELEASIAASDSEIEDGPKSISETWTLPRNDYRSTPGSRAANGTSIPTPANPKNDDTFLQMRSSRRYSPPAMSRRYRPSITYSPASNLSSVSINDRVNKDGAAETITTESVHRDVNHGTVSMKESHTASEARTILNDCPQTPLSQIPNGHVAIEGLSDGAETLVAIELPIDVTRLRIRDASPPSGDTPKATSHSGERLKRLTRAQLRRKQLEEEALNQYEIVPLSANWDTKVREAIRQGYGSYASSDLARAVPEYAGRGQDNWLNDEVINGYLNLVTAHGKKNDRPNQTPSYHAFNSFFYTNLSTKGPESVMKWSKRPKINGTNLLNVEAVFIPINTGLHWTLAVVEPKRKTVTHYNSMSSTALGMQACAHIMKWIAKELGKDFNEDEWTVVAAGESPQQTNSDDCGVFTITSARQIMLGFKPMSYKSDQMRVQRKRIVAELINNGLLKSKEDVEE